MTDLGAVVALLKKERDKLDRAIAALSGVGGGGSVDRASCQRQPANGSLQLNAHGGRSSRRRRDKEIHRRCREHAFQCASFFFAVVHG